MNPVFRNELLVAVAVFVVSMGCQGATSGPSADTSERSADVGDTTAGDATHSPGSDAADVDGNGGTSDTESPVDAADAQASDVADADRSDSGADAVGADSVGADAGPGADGVGDATADGSMDVDAPTYPGSARLILQVDRPWVRTKVVGDSVGLRCFPVDAMGNRQKDPGDIAISIAGGKGTKTKKGRWQFKSPGTVQVTCESPSLGMTTRRELVVAYPGIDYRYAEGSALVEAVPEALRAALEANADLDKSAFTKAVDRLEARAKAAPELKGVDFLVDNPNGWPSASDLKQAGLSGGSDDSKWVAALKSLRQAVQKERAALDTLTKMPTAADRKAVRQAVTATEAAYATFRKLSPSALAVWEHRAKLGALSRAVVRTSELRARKLAAILRANPPMASGPGSFSAIGSVAGLVISNVTSGYTYQDILIKAGKVAVANIISKAIKNLINSQIPASADAPSLAYTQTGALSGVVKGGQAFGARGKFSGDADQTRIIFVPPAISKHLANVVDAVKSVRSAMSSQNVLIVVNEIRKAINTVESIGKGISRKAGSFIVLKPNSAIGVGDHALLQFPALPTGLNCKSPLGAPIAGTMIPIDMHSGAGKAVNVNVLGESGSNCP